MDYSSANISVSFGPESDVRGSSNPEYPSVSVDDYGGTGYVTTTIALPRDAAARARLAGRLAEAFRGIHVAAAAIVVEAAVRDAVAAHDALGHDGTGCGCLDSIESFADDARASAHQPTEAVAALERVTAAAAARNRAVRVASGLEWADGHVSSYPVADDPWYPDASGALEARGMDGDR